MPDEKLKQKLTAILSADVKDYSRLMSQDRVGTINTIKSHRNLFSDFIQQYGGQVIDNPGDEILATFESVSDTVNCAVEIQRELAEQNAEIPSARMMQWRIGINLGEIIEEQGRIYGDSVNIAARIERLSEPGGISISGTVYDHVKDRLGLVYEYIGEQELKNTQDPVRVYMVFLQPGSPTNREETASLLGKPSIVVLPFANMSPDSDQEYFSDGLTEEIITDLSHIQDLLVISRSSAMTFKGTKITIPEIARSLNVRFVLEGSVRKAGNDLRITAQLIDAPMDAHLWAEKYSGTLDNIFDIQEKVSRSIVDALKLKLRPEEETKIQERPIEDLKAYEYYLKADSEIFKFTAESSYHALRYLQNALDIIGDNASLYSCMAWALWQLVNVGAEQEDYLVKAEEYAKKALLIDSASAKAHTILGLIDILQGKQLYSVPKFLKALEGNQNEILAIACIVNVYVHAGRISEAASYQTRAMQIDPLSVPANWYEGGINYYNGKLDLALQSWRRFYELHPKHPYSLFVYALILAYHRQVRESVMLLDQNAKVNPDEIFAKLGLVLKYAIQGDKQKALQEITPDLQRTSRRDAMYSHHLAGFLSLINEKEKALHWLDNAINIGLINYRFLNEHDSFLENIRSEVSFKKLMDKAKYQSEHFKLD